MTATRLRPFGTTIFTAMPARAGVVASPTSAFHDADAGRTLVRSRSASGRTSSGRPSSAS